MEFKEWLLKYKCDKKECVWWGYPQYNGVCCRISKECSYYKIKKIIQTKLVDF